MIIYSNVSNSEIALRSQAGIPISIMPGQSFIGPSYYKRYCDTNGIVAYTDKTNDDYAEMFERIIYRREQQDKSQQHGE